jgi:hypothetical protein
VASISRSSSARTAELFIATNVATIDVPAAVGKIVKLLANAGGRNNHMNKRIHVFPYQLLLPLLIVYSMRSGLGSAVRDETSSESQSKHKVSAQAPSVKRLADGTYDLVLTPNQQNAVTQLLGRNPGLRLANFKDSGDQQKVVQVMQVGQMQYPFACWGDLNRDGYLDVALVFVSKQPVNNWGWREWWIVAFHGSRRGQFTPVVVTKDTSGCFDGMLYHKKNNSVEFSCFGVAAGSFRWNGNHYVVQPKVGD